MLRLPRTSPRPSRSGAGALAAISAGALALAAPGVALGQSGTIQVQPVAGPGAEVVITGTAPGCPDPRLLLISRAFPGPMEFAGVPAVWARLDARDRFSASVTLPAGLKPGGYTITGRCGGGNIGASASLRVVARQPLVQQTIASAASNGFRVRVDALRTGGGAAPPARVRITAFERRGGAWVLLGRAVPVLPAPGATDFFWKVVTAPGALRDFTLTTAAPQRVSLRVLISPSVGFSQVNRYHVVDGRLVRG